MVTILTLVRSRFGTKLTVLITIILTSIILFKSEKVGNEKFFKISLYNSHDVQSINRAYCYTFAQIEKT